MQADQSRAAARRYATLRGALRAMAPAPELLDAGSIESRFAEIRRLLQGSAGDAPDPEAQRKVEAALDGLTDDLVATSDKVSFWQYRATLPIVLEQAPKDLESLLEVCMVGSVRRWTDLVDYLVTLLATRESEGHRSVHSDPSTICACIEEICGQAAEEATAEADDLESRLGEACDALERGEPVGEIVQRVREIKRNATADFFVPTVLRRVVAFNAAVHNRMAQQEETRRSLHEAELDVMSQDEPPDPITGSNDLPAYGSFELGRVEKALGDRLARRKSTDNHAARVAATFDLQKMSAFEKMIFADESDDHVGSVVRAVITIGLVVRHLDAVCDDLRALGIDPDWMRRSSSGEIDALAQQGTREFMRTGNFDHAQQLAELRSRYLNPLFDEERMIPKPTVASGASVTPPAPVSRPARTGPPRTGRKTRLLEDEPEPKKLWWRIPAIAVLALAIVGGIVAGLNGGDETRDGAQYSNTQLMAISPFLTSGYRSDDGRGNSFTGNVNAAWARLSSTEQRENASRIGAHFAKQGITSVKFYDIDRTLRFHFEHGSIRELR
jgi:hypothetical protein